VDGVEKAVDFDNPYGLVDFLLEPGEHQVRIAFEDTPLRMWSARLSCLCLLLLLLAPLGPKLLSRGKQP
jgi:hypothetical protein